MLVAILALLFLREEREVVAGVVVELIGVASIERFGVAIDSLQNFCVLLQDVGTNVVSTRNLTGGVKSCQISRFNQDSLCLVLSEWGVVFGLLPTFFYLLKSSTIVLSHCLTSPMLLYGKLENVVFSVMVISIVLPSSTIIGRGTP